MTSVKEFFDRKTSTLTYVVYRKDSKDAVVIDPVWNFDAASGALSTSSVDQVTDFLSSHSLNLHLILETHAHADHVSGAQKLKETFPRARLLIGDRIIEVQKTFKELYNLPDSFRADGSQFDGLLKDHEIVRAGQMEFKVLHTPGHTPACCTYVFKGLAFTGDGLFMPDSGTGRCDFPGGNAHTLFQSVTTKLYTLPNETLLYPAHDYQPGGRPLEFSASVEKHKKENIHLQVTTSEEDFVNFRQERDSQLAAPQLLWPSLQINIRGGRLPEAESNGVSYLKIPLKI
jgi:glyoxylase-like metal-dependent hydrolase (beta-lactamase superfamily II)